MTAAREHDWRLVPATIFIWGAAAMGQLAWSFGLSLMLGLAVAAGLAGLIAARRGLLSRVATWLVLLTCFLGVAASALAMSRLSDRAASPLAEAAASEAFVRIDGMVASRPRIVGEKGDRAVVEIHAHAMQSGSSEIALDDDVILLGSVDLWNDAVPGNPVHIEGKAYLPSRPSSAVALLIDGAGSQVEPTTPRWSAAAEVVRAELARAASVNDSDIAGLLVAMVDGDTAGISPIVQESFRRSGLAHLLAVSGANVAIIIGAVLWLSRLGGIPLAGQVGIASLALLAFLLVVGPEPSVLRAGGMGVVMLVALASGRPRAAIPALCAAIVVLVIWMPPLATSVGFILSVLATAGIVVLGARWTERLSNRMPRALAAAFAVAASAAVATLPVVVLLMPLVNLASVLANIAAAPAVPFATILGASAAVLAPFAMPAAELLCYLAGFFVRWIAWVAKMSAEPGPAQVRLPAGAPAAIIVIAGGVIVAALWVLTRRYPTGRTALIGALVGVLVLSVPARCAVRTWPPSDWLIAACDVGQGDALVARVSASTGIVLDTGPDAARLDVCLSELGIEQVELLVLTHLHSDHVGGVDAVLGMRPTERLAISGREPGAVENALRDQAADAGTQVVEAEAGWRLTLSGVVVEVLGPPAAAASLVGDANNQSLIVRIETPGASLLITGDAEAPEMQAMLACDCLRADVLKVPHHGSKNRDDRFLAQTEASLALISVGEGNDYGHPAPSTLAELRALGMDIARTDQEGTLVVGRRDGELWVSGMQTDLE